MKTPSFTQIAEKLKGDLSQNESLVNGVQSIEDTPKNLEEIDENAKKSDMENSKISKKSEKIKIKGKDLAHVLSLNPKKTNKNFQSFQEEHNKEKEELLNKILVLEKNIQRKNELLEENLFKIRDFHLNEEASKLAFYKQLKDYTNKNKSLTLELESFREKALQSKEIILECQRQIQQMEELLTHKTQENKTLLKEIELKNEENNRLCEINNELIQGNQERKDFFKDFHAFNEKIKGLYEENQKLKDKIQFLEEEIQRLNSQKEFLCNAYEKNKEDLCLQLKKVRFPPKTY